MSLDAYVFCDCFERRKHRVEPPVEVVLDAETGEVHPGPACTVDEQIACDRWRVSACEHEDQMLVHHHLGNIALIAAIRATLGRTPERFPILLTRVVYNGIHAGDCIAPELFDALATEVENLSQAKTSKRHEAGWIECFGKQLRELLAAARTLNRPIAF